MKSFFVLCVAINLWLIPAQAAVVKNDNPRDAVVKVFVTSNDIDYYRPWQSKGSQSSSGSGCVIAGNKILTNAHVINESTFIQVRKESDPRKYTARVEAIGHDCDLAVLTVDNPKFFDGITPFEIGELPNLQEVVTALGYPTGGDKLSITEGVISRVEIIPYTQSAKKLLAVQIDAAINPGNSGGPVLLNGKLVGVAMQVMTNSQNIGYMIPTPVINHFSSDLILDKKYDGFPTLGIEFHNTENKTLREFYKIANNDGGVLITKVLPYTSAYNQLKEGDVITSLDGVPVAVDGTFEFRKGERLELSYLIDKRQAGEKIDIKFIRDGKEMNASIDLEPYVGLIPYPNYSSKPPYYIYGGLIFTVLSSDLFESWGGKWWERAPVDFLYYLMGSGRLNEKIKKEIVVLLEVLPDDINVGYHEYSNEVITKVNGKDFKSFEEFVTELNGNSGQYTVLETENNLKIVLDNQAVQKSTLEILSRNNIPAQYSPDVAEWLKKETVVVNDTTAKVPAL